MSFRYSPTDPDADVSHRTTPSTSAAPGKSTLTSRHVMRAQRDDQGVAPGADAAVEGAAGSTGAPLPADLRGRFESSLGTDLSAVRIHTGDASAQANDAVGARAYTTGQDIHFGAGQYDPSSASGQVLIAHEVAHTVQQQGAAPTRQHKLSVSTPGDAHEVEADRAAEAMVSGAPASVSGAGAGLARKPSAKPAATAAPKRYRYQLKSGRLPQGSQPTNLAVGEAAKTLDGAVRAKLVGEGVNAGWPEFAKVLGTIASLRDSGSALQRVLDTGIRITLANVQTTLCDIEDISIDVSATLTNPSQISITEDEEHLETSFGSSGGISTGTSSGTSSGVSALGKAGDDNIGVEVGAEDGKNSNGSVGESASQNLGSSMVGAVEFNLRFAFDASISYRMSPRHIVNASAVTVPGLIMAPVAQTLLREDVRGEPLAAGKASGNVMVPKRECKKIPVDGAAGVIIGTAAAMADVLGEGKLGKGSFD